MKRILGTVMLLTLWSGDMAMVSGETSGPLLRNEAEWSLWQAIAARFESTPDVRRNDAGQVIAIRVTDLAGQHPAAGWVEVQVEPESGRVTRLTSDRAAFDNALLARCAAFEKLQSLKLWSNGPPSSEEPQEHYNGAGMAALANLKDLVEVMFTSGTFDDEGLVAVAGVASMETLVLWRTRVTDAGIVSLQQHPNLRRIRLSPFWEKRITDAGLAALSSIPLLEVISIGETWLTDQGLAFLHPLGERLREVSLANCLIHPRAVRELREALPETKVEWDGLAAVGAIFRAHRWQLDRIAAWAPAPLIEQAMRAAE